MREAFSTIITGLERKTHLNGFSKQQFFINSTQSYRLGEID